jgi:hypothetical protein
MIALAERATETLVRSRMAEAVQLRDAAIELVQARGEWTEDSNGELREECFSERHGMFTGRRGVVVDSDGLSICHLAYPVSDEDEMDDSKKVFGIELWDADHEFLSVVWNDDKVRINSFLRGDWEDKLLAHQNKHRQQRDLTN